MATSPVSFIKLRGTRAKMTNPPEGTTPKLYYKCFELGEHETVVLVAAYSALQSELFAMSQDDGKKDHAIESLNAKLAEANATVKERNDYLADTLNQIGSLRAQLEETQARLSACKYRCRTLSSGLEQSDSYNVRLEADNEALRKALSLCLDEISGISEEDRTTAEKNISRKLKAAVSTPAPGQGEEVCIHEWATKGHLDRCSKCHAEIAVRTPK